MCVLGVRGLDGCSFFACCWCVKVEVLVLLLELEVDGNLLLSVDWWDDKWLFLEVQLFTAFVRSWHLH
jgi:hypothetical protein